MVLSNLCYAHRELGVAFVVPCRRLIQTADELITEARELAEAERLDDWTWGAVGVLANPTSRFLARSLRDGKSLPLKGFATANFLRSTRRASDPLFPHRVSCGCGGHAELVT